MENLNLEPKPQKSDEPKKLKQEINVITKKGVVVALEIKTFASPDDKNMQPGEYAVRRIKPPMRPRSAYMFFVKDNFTTYRQHFKTRDPIYVMNRLVHWWTTSIRDGPDAELYRQQAADDQARYKDEVTKWLELTGNRIPRFARLKRRAQNLPLRPLTPFFCYKQEAFTEVYKATGSQQEALKILGANWNEMSQSMKNIYKQEARQRKVEYVEKLKASKEISRDLKVQKQFEKMDAKTRRLATLKAQIAAHQQTEIENIATM